MSLLCECERAERGREGGGGGSDSDTTPTRSSVVEKQRARTVVVTERERGLQFYGAARPVKPVMTILFLLLAVWPALSRGKLLPGSAEEKIFRNLVLYF